MRAGGKAMRAGGKAMRAGGKAMRPEGKSLAPSVAGRSCDGIEQLELVARRLAP